MKKTFLFAACGALAALGCSGGPDDYGPVAEIDSVPLGPLPDRDQWENDHPELASPTGDESQKACPTRSDFAHLVNLHPGFWGNWAGCIDFCPFGSYAYGINIKSEPPQGNGLPPDDTAANAVSLHCYWRAGGGFADYAESNQGPWGSWLPGHGCPNGTADPLEGGNLLMEFPIGGGDDTALNQIAFTCNTTPQIERGVPASTSWGGWTGRRSCPGGTQVCGIKTRVEPNQGSGSADDTALNGVDFACCHFQ